MDVIKTMPPGEPGTKRFQNYYGEKLVCVRYRKQAHQNKRLTTVELIIEKGAYLPDKSPIIKKIYPSANRNVYVRIDFDEKHLQQRVKQAGAKWAVNKKRWVMRYRDAKQLGLNNRVSELENTV